MQVQLIKALYKILAVNKKRDSKKIKSAYEPWNEPDLDLDRKKYWDDPKNKENFIRAQKVRTELLDMHKKIFSLVNACKAYLSNLDECPDDKNMVNINKKFVEEMLNQAKELDKTHLKSNNLIWGISEVSKN